MKSGGTPEKTRPRDSVTFAAPEVKNNEHSAKIYVKMIVQMILRSRNRAPGLS